MNTKFIHMSIEKLRARGKEREGLGLLCLKLLHDFEPVACLLKSVVSIPENS